MPDLLLYYTYKTERPIIHSLVSLTQRLSTHPLALASSRPSQPLLWTAHGRYGILVSHGLERASDYPDGVLLIFDHFMPFHVRGRRRQTW